MTRLIAAFVAVILWTGMAGADTMRMAVTTSFQNSGLSDVLLPAFEGDTGIEVQLIVVGTGQAIRLGQAGDVDAILVHSRAAEDAFMAEGFGTHRREIMYNDFVLIGPAADPAGIADVATVSEALRAILESESVFVSRGDDSGTHKKELSLWTKIEADPQAFGPWYRAVGAGMGAALNVAAGVDGYILADRASWLNFGNKAGLALLFAGDPVLFNQYAFLPVNPERHPHVKSTAAKALEDWLVSEKAEALINGYTIGGETLFTFNAAR
ncbi:substrate-binding domain-containing protein [Marimonas sp. MJW-29]|uniref:Substrate-binding domain-containing protein n=1 Tax=Sulfitobacter sediminis TaxID=3234186 RepID=A0ABV3RJN8_9RHOB